MLNTSTFLLTRLYCTTLKSNGKNVGLFAFFAAEKYLMISVVVSLGPRVAKKKLVWVGLFEKSRRGAVVLIQFAISKGGTCIAGEMGDSLGTMDSFLGRGRKVQSG